MSIANRRGRHKRFLNPSGCLEWKHCFIGVLGLLWLHPQPRHCHVFIRKLTTRLLFSAPRRVVIVAWGFICILVEDSDKLRLHRVEQILFSFYVLCSPQQN